MVRAGAVRGPGQGLAPAAHPGPRRLPRAGGRCGRGQERKCERGSAADHRPARWQRSQVGEGGGRSPADRSRPGV